MPDITEGAEEDDHKRLVVFGFWRQNITYQQATEVHVGNKFAPSV